MCFPNEPSDILILQGDNLKRTTTALRAIILVRLNEWKKCSALLERSAVGSAGNSVLSEAAEAAQRLGAVVSSLTAMIHNPCIVYECVNGAQMYRHTRVVAFRLLPFRMLD